MEGHGRYHENSGHPEKRFIPGEPGEQGDGDEWAGDEREGWGQLLDRHGPAPVFSENRGSEGGYRIGLIHHKAGSENEEDHPQAQQGVREVRSDQGDGHHQERDE